MLAFSFFAAIFSSLLWLIYAVAYVQDNTVGVKFSSLGIVDISIYVGLVILPVLVLWMIFGYINQHLNNQKTAKAIYQLFLQMRKNQEYTDLVARIMLESEQQIKDGFILNRIDILISDMNELIAEIISRAALASRDQIESLWSRVKNGGKWALGKVIIEINQNQPNFQMRLYEKAQNDLVLSGTILEFCARYQNILSLLNKHDSERVFLSVVETGVFGKVFTILAPLADEIRKYRDVSFNKSDTNLDFKAPEPKVNPSYLNKMPEQENVPLSEKKNPIMGGLSKIGAFIKRDKNQKSASQSNHDIIRDPFSIALERSFGEPTLSDPLPENNDVHVSIDVNEETVPDIKLPSSEENNSQDIILPKINTDEPPSFALNANVADEKEDSVEISVTNTQKTLNNLRKEWEEMKKNSLENPVEEELPKVVNSDEAFSYPFGGWTDENNYNK